MGFLSSLFLLIPTTTVLGGIYTPYVYTAGSLEPNLPGFINVKSALPRMLCIAAVAPPVSLDAPALRHPS